MPLSTIIKRQKFNNSNWSLPQEFAGICPVVLSRNEENLPLKWLITQKLTVWSNVYDFCQSQQKSHETLRVVHEINFG